ncbi:MAG: tetratricopeptide repeat protein [Polyangiaceae bacterium]
MRARLALVLGVALGCGCAPTYANGYQEALARGLAAKNAGRYEEAIAALEEAANLGERYKDRDEARYVEGTLYEKMGKWEEASATYARVATESGGRYQGVRSEFARAEVEQQHIDKERGDALMIEAVRRNPSSGLSRHAVRRMVGPIEKDQGPDAAIQFLHRFTDVAKGTDLDEELLYEEGLILFRAGKHAEARDLFIASARNHPYPLGALTDDALYQAALCAEVLGDYDQAIALLVELLGPMESAYAGSSYERPRFPEAQYKIAMLYLTRKHDRARAKKELRKMLTDHNASRFVDDALWLEGRLELKDGETAAACDSMDELLGLSRDDGRPPSRFTRCLQLLCPSMPAGDKPCADYISRELVNDPEMQPAEITGPVPLPQESRFTE